MFFSLSDPMTRPKQIFSWFALTKEYRSFLCVIVCVKKLEQTYKLTKPFHWVTCSFITMNVRTVDHFYVFFSQAVAATNAPLIFAES